MKTYPDQFTPWHPDKMAAMTITSAEQRDLGIKKDAAIAATAALPSEWRNGALQQLLKIINGGA